MDKRMEREIDIRILQKMNDDALAAGLIGKSLHMRLRDAQFGKLTCIGESDMITTNEMLNN